MSETKKHIFMGPTHRTRDTISVDIVSLTALIILFKTISTFHVNCFDQTLNVIF